MIFLSLVAWCKRVNSYPYQKGFYPYIFFSSIKVIDFIFTAITLQAQYDSVLLMTFHDFPMDKQKCFLNITSCKSLLFISLKLLQEQVIQLGSKRGLKWAKNSRSAENYYDGDLGNLDDVQNLVTEQFERLRVKGICDGFLVEE